LRKDETAAVSRDRCQSGQLGGLSDHELMALLGDGCREALAELVRRHQGAVLSLARRFLGRDELAEDVCQEAFVRVFQQAGRYRPTASFSTWLYRIVSNLCWDQRRRAARAPAALEHDAPDEAPEPSVAGQRDELRQRVRQAVAALPDRQRLALVMHRFCGMGHSEIAAATGWSPKAVESCLTRAYATLRRQLADLEQS